MWLAKKLGIDKSIAYTSAGQMVSAGGGFLTALFILKFLNPEEQGYYYTFKSILAIQVFFELGMNTVITQYVAHDTAHLQWEGTHLTGNERYLSRLSSLFHFCKKWYLAFSIMLLLVLLIGGNNFFNTNNQDSASIEWQVPWIILCITTALNLLLTPVFSYLQGLGLVKEVARYYFYKYSIYLISVLLAFACGTKLYALSIGNIAYILVSLYFLFATSFGKILYHIIRIPITEKVSYVKEIFPFQWKIAMSWVSGYFIFQLFTPVLFATDGAAVAGQMGMTLTVLTGIQAFTFSWTSTKIPTYSTLIEKREYGSLDTTFNRTLRQATFINLGCLVVFFAIIYSFRYFNIIIFNADLPARFLPAIPMLLMMIPEYANQFITAWATYLRCHKKEPFLIYSIVTAILCALSTLFVGKYFGLYGITIGYCSITVLLTPWAYYIYKSKQKIWHSN